VTGPLLGLVVEGVDVRGLVRAIRDGGRAGGVRYLVEGMEEPGRLLPEAADEVHDCGLATLGVDDSGDGQRIVG